MSDVLEQSEIDALLAAVEQGSTIEDGAATAPTETQRSRPPDVRTYDFKRPKRVSKDQVRALEAMHEGFSRNFGASLSGFLRTIIEVRVASTEQLTYSEFLHSLPNPTCFNLLRAPPLEGQMCLEISPLIIYPIIDRLLGGSNNEMFIPQRPLTGIELRLVQRIIDQALDNLSEVWGNLASVSFKLVETESNPHLVQIVAPSEVVVVVGFEIKMGPRAGTMSFCIPFNVIDPVMSKLASQSWVAYQHKAGTEDQIECMTRTLGTARVQLRAFAAECEITLEDLINLRPGDIIQTEKPIADELIIQVEGRNKFAGHAGKLKGNRAFQITRRVVPGESI